MKRVISRPVRSLQNNILAGIITVGPLFVTWLVFSFLFSNLAKAGLPLVQLLAPFFHREWLNEPMTRSAFAVLLTLILR